MTGTAIRTMIGLMAAAIFTACGGTDITGKWVEPVPGMENMTQGIDLRSDGKASSINMATLRYEKWEKKDSLLILSGKSIGNQSEISFTDTLVIQRLTNDELTLKRGNWIINYHRQ